MKEIKDYSLLPHNTFGMDVKASLFVEYESVTELQSILSDKNLMAGNWLHIGGGSNLLFKGDYAGTVLHSAIRGYEVVTENEQEIEVRAGAGEVWDDFVAYTVKNSWYGAENLSLIPGEVGASAVQNIGAYGVEAKDLIVSVEKRGGEVALENVRKVIIAVREAKLPDPRVQGNAGSFFMNPIVPRRQFEIVQQQYPDMPHYEVDGNRVKIPAAWMIDRCGWKGKQIGRAGVHSKQALVLVNCGGATGDEVIALARRIQESVLQKFGVAISPEVNFI